MLGTMGGRSGDRVSVQMYRSNPRQWAEFEAPNCGSRVGGLRSLRSSLNILKHPKTNLTFHMLLDALSRIQPPTTTTYTIRNLDIHGKTRVWLASSDENLIRIVKTYFKKENKWTCNIWTRRLGKRSCLHVCLAIRICPESLSPQWHDCSMPRNSLHRF